MVTRNSDGSTEWWVDGKRITKSGDARLEDMQRQMDLQAAQLKQLREKFAEYVFPVE